MNPSLPIDGPRRTCVGCHTVDEQRALVRVTRDGANLRVDDVTRRTGRGAYVHARSSCFAGATKDGFSRSFRSAISGASIASIHQQIQNVRSEGSNE
ncbi:MAG: YlxR family protein [Myxococcales bacterium]|nr:YlxR family protein [Myxococcales bacterium]